MVEVPKNKEESRKLLPQSFGRQTNDQSMSKTATIVDVLSSYGKPDRNLVLRKDSCNHDAIPNSAHNNSKWPVSEVFSGPAHSLHITPDNPTIANPVLPATKDQSLQKSPADDQINGAEGIGRPSPQFANLITAQRHSINQQVSSPPNSSLKNLESQRDLEMLYIKRHQARKAELDAQIAKLVSVKTATLANSMRLRDQGSSSNSEALSDLGALISSGSATLVDPSDGSSIGSSTIPRLLNQELRLGLNLHSPEKSQVDLLSPGIENLADAVQQNSSIEAGLTPMTKRKRTSVLPPLKKPRIDMAATQTQVHRPARSNQIDKQPGQHPSDSFSKTKRVSKRISQFFLRDLPPTEEEKPSQSDRPVSWPRTPRWRRSVGMSVKALTEGFEKLNIDRSRPPIPN